MEHVGMWGEYYDYRCCVRHCFVLHKPMFCISVLEKKTFFSRTQAEILKWITCTLSLLYKITV
jgi:hypothetical protein